MSKIKIGKGRSSFLLEMGCISFCIWMDTESIYNRMMHCHEQSYSSRPVPDPDVLVVVTAFCGKMPVYTQYIHTYHIASNIQEVNLVKYTCALKLRDEYARAVNDKYNVKCRMLRKFVPLVCSLGFTCCLLSHTSIQHHVRHTSFCDLETFGGRRQRKQKQKHSEHKIAVLCALLVLLS